MEWDQTWHALYRGSPKVALTLFGGIAMLEYAERRHEPDLEERDEQLFRGLIMRLELDMEDTDA